MFGEFGDDAQKAIDALKGGSFEAQDTEDNLDAATSEESSVVDDSVNTDSDTQPDLEDQPEQEMSDQEDGDSETKDDADLDAEGGQPKAEDIEFVSADGKKIKVDFNDRERIKKAYQMAAGMRKFQSERDAISKERDDYRVKYEENQKIIDDCDAVIDDDEALFRLITGGRELGDVIQAKMDERDELAAMSPEALDAYKRNQDFEKRERELKKREASVQSEREKATSDLNTSEMKRQQTMVNSAFVEHRFAGKLGSKKKELQADRMLWRDVVERLEQYDSVNQELINQVVAEASEDLRSIVNIQAERQVKKQVKQQKKASTQKAQEAVFDKDASKQEDLKKKINDGDMTSALQDVLGSGLSFFN